MDERCETDVKIKKNRMGTSLPDSGSTGLVLALASASVSSLSEEASKLHWLCKNIEARP
jgi:hypothetical protein